MPFHSLLQKIKTHRSWLIDIALLGGILSLFYAFCLGSYPLFTPDEGRYSEVAREMVATGDYITPRVNGVPFLDKPILYYWLQATAIHLFGLNEWALRFFPALLGIFGCLMSYICGRQLFVRRTGFVAALILGATPLYFTSAHYANLDLEVAVFISCALLSFITAVHKREAIQTKWLLATYMFAALAFLTKGMIGFAFPAMIIGIWIIATRRWNLLLKTRLITGLLLAFVIVLPWYILAQRDNPEFFHYFFITQQITRFLSAAEFNSHAPFWFYIPIVLLGFFPWTLFLGQAIFVSCQKTYRYLISHPEGKAQQKLGEIRLFLIIWFLTVFIFFSIPHSKIISYILPAFPPLAMLTANYLVSTFTHIKPNHVRVTAIIFAILSAIIASILLAIPHYGWLDLDPTVTPYLVAIATIFLLSAGATFFFVRSSFAALLSVCAVATITALLILVLSATNINTSTAKPLIAKLLTVIKPEDEIVNYFKYYYDTPLYLQKRVSIVADWKAPDIEKKDNWRRELWNGMAFQKTDDWLISEKIFWQRWNSKRRLFVFLNTNYLMQFEKHTKKYHLIGQHNEILLLSNKPTK